MSDLKVESGQIVLSEKKDFIGETKENIGNLFDSIKSIKEDNFTMATPEERAQVPGKGDFLGYLKDSFDGAIFDAKNLGNDILNLFGLGKKD